jgi:molecular chaperone GrpE
MAFSMTFKKKSKMTEQAPPQSEQETVETEKQEQETVAQQETGREDDALRQQLEEARNKYLYLLSDFDNYKRHAAKERMELTQTAGREIITALLPLLDDFERAAKITADGLPEGIALIHHKLVNTLQSKGLKAIETKAGDDFNADVHEAVAEVPAANDASRGKIIDVLEAGYLLGERIIRYAKVVVGR